MIPTTSAPDPTAGVLCAAAVYVLVGAAVGVGLRWQGEESATAWSALFAWPLLLPVLTGAAGVKGGPLAGRIDEAFAALERALPTPDPAWSADLAALRRSLHTADVRLSRVDRLLAEAAGNPAGPEAAALRSARDRAAGEVLEVLAAMERLRLQLGLTWLAGEGARVGDHLRQLRARVAALEEVER